MELDNYLLERKKKTFLTLEIENENQIIWNRMKIFIRKVDINIRQDTDVGMEWNQSGV